MRRFLSIVARVVFDRAQRQELSVRKPEAGPGTASPRSTPMALRQRYLSSVAPDPSNLGLRIGTDTPRSAKPPETSGFESPRCTAEDVLWARSRRNRHITGFFGALGGRSHLLRFQRVAGMGKDFRCSLLV